MFSHIPDFYPTPIDVIEKMTEGINLKDKTILEPSAGKGNIVDFCAGSGAHVIACEKDEDLQKILQTKCKIIAPDFLTVTSDQVSHIDAIIMNPPFSKGAEHILHAYNIAPAGCKIVALCNAATLGTDYSAARKQLNTIVENYGHWESLGDCFAQAERKTGVDVAMITLNKPGQNKSSEFEGFFMEEDQEAETGAGLMSYNVVRDLVNRYVAAVKLYDEQLVVGQRMHSLLNGFYGETLTFSCTEKGAPKLRNEFKKDLQKAGWKFIFNKMNMEKYATRGLREDINKFVEQQQNIPFTMRNIYHMLQIVIGTQGQRMDKALIEVFDKLTAHHDENRLNLPGWKTNSHYLVNKRFIFPYVGSVDAYRWRSNYNKYNIYRSDCDTLEDLEKALCYITGENWDDIQTLPASCRDNNYGEWYECHFFKYKGFKKGTLHVEFKDDELHAKFNQHVARIKGYPLFEGKKQTAYQERQTGRAKQEKAEWMKDKKEKAPWVPSVLFEVDAA
jgi:hypothetical protein